MTQQAHRELPAWIGLAIIVVAFLGFVGYIIIILQYNTLSEIAKALSPIDVTIGISLSILGIVIGIIIAIFQKRQGDEIHQQDRDIARVVQGVDTQTRRITETLEEIRRVDREARARDNRRRNFHLFHIMSEVTRLRDRVARRVNLIQQRIIENQDVTLEQWNHERELVRIRERAQAEAAMEIVATHFRAIDDLIRDPRLPADLNIHIWHIADLLARMRDLRDPIDDFHDRDELLDSIRELQEQMLVALDDDLHRLERENVPV